MSEENNAPSSSADLEKNSLLYQHYLAQRDEVLKHKQAESGKVGHDIGFERALTDWTLRHRSEWLKRWRGEARSSETRTIRNWSGGTRPAW